MPISKTRHKHGHQYHPNRKVHAKKETLAPVKTKAAPRKSAVTIMVILLAIFGTGIAFLSAGADTVWLLGGALLGAVTGYFIGQSMDKMAARNK